MKRLSITLLVLLTTSLLIFAAEDRTAITIYNQGIALVREFKSLDVTKGRQTYDFTGVASQIDPTSVLFQGKGLQVLEQNYEYDLANSWELLNRYVGKKIEIVLESELIKGIVISPQDPLLIQEEEGTVRSVARSVITTVNFPELPEGLFLKPTLRWELISEKKGSYEAEISYITRGIQWEASYIAVVSSDETKLDLSGWVQIDNKSGADYRDAKLKLMAGDVKVERKRGRRARLDESVLMMDKAGGSGFEEKSFSDFHLYTLPRPVSVMNKQVKQIALFEPATTPYNKIYEYPISAGQTKVNIILEFKNEKENGLGMPLPKGKVRVMKRDSDQSMEFIGEDRIDHTAERAEIRLDTGSAFDIFGKTTITDTKRQGATHISTYEIELTNSAKESKTIIAIQKFGYGNWEVKDESFNGKKRDAFNYEWSIKLAPGASTTFTYTTKMW